MFEATDFLAELTQHIPPRGGTADAPIQFVFISDQRKLGKIFRKLQNALLRD